MLLSLASGASVVVNRRVPAVAYGLTGVAAYLIGSIPTGYLVARARGVDITRVGSGNIGATNAFRVLGKGPGALVLAVDALKGFLPAALIMHFLASLHDLLPGVYSLEMTTDPEARVLLGITAGIASVLGHNFTPWLGFKGGKGIATTAGVLLALLPKVLGITFAGWVIVFAATRYVSVASLFAAVAVPSLTWWLSGSPALRGFTIALGILATWKHRANIQRLMNGTESRFGAKKAEGNAGNGGGQ
jgi:glycerol-3-phosphate acyltransferase PlsY